MKLEQKRISVYFLSQKPQKSLLCRNLPKDTNVGMCVSIQRQLNSYLQTNVHINMGENNNSNQSIIHIDQTIGQNDVYNQYKKIQETAYKTEQFKSLFSVYRGYANSPNSFDDEQLASIIDNINSLKNSFVANTNENETPNSRLVSKDVK
ncbi:hypothetical protein BDF21DRAFT_461439 [Thamnidium elegans]|uniref:Uncharacterized protein n=1 Tax=Thamnidium elegans TaxID=101142 RepID=A0A8H7SR66_9FUNG|nr:hypothetical protein INT48_006313 [Thamnidium elegans]KAI8085523.1 hypothetical protein BDF21DRAFT_461439 [Thamnidium elegans]